MAIVRGTYAIIDLPHRGGLRPDEALGAVLAGGCRSVQLREKDGETRGRIALLRSLAPLCAAADATLWVNDDLDAALVPIAGVTGLHVGQTDLVGLRPGWRSALREADLRLGVSTHELEQVEDARRYAPDYLAFGPVFPTSGKEDAERVVGLELLATACAVTSIPVVAIGGIDASRAGACVRAGASAVAVIGALVDDSAEGVRTRTRTLVEASARALAPRSPGAIRSGG